jgi:hypothetical protein
MIGESHGFPISSAGMFGLAQASGPVWLKITTEGAQERYFYYAAAVSGIAPTPANFTQVSIFDYATGTQTFQGAKCTALFGLPALASAPSTPTAGYMYFDTGLLKALIYNGTSWVAVGSGSGGGAAGGTNAGGYTDQAFLETETTVSANWTIGSGAYASGCSTSLTNNLFTMNGHSFVADQMIHFSGTLTGSGLTADTPYWVLSGGFLTTNTFQVSAIGPGGTLFAATTSSGSFNAGRIKSAVTGSTVAIATGVTVTIPTGSTWTIV